MKHLNIAKRIIGVGLLAAGCLDLNLLDNMVLMDAGQTESSSETKEAPGSDPEGPPAADPTDKTAPGITVSDCSGAARVDENLCIIEGPVSASVRFETDEPAVVTALDAPSVTAVLSEPWAETHWVVSTGLDAKESVLRLKVADVNGNETICTVTLIPESTPTAVITEVLADPKGAEPAQEFIEVANVGRDALDLSFWMIDDNGDKNGDPLPEGSTLEPGGIALLVSSAFNAADPNDPMPDPAAVIIRLDTGICSNGLKNSDGESIELYDADGNLVSRYDGTLVTSKEGQSVARRYMEIPPGDPQAYRVADGEATPGLAATLMP